MCVAEYDVARQDNKQGKVCLGRVSRTSVVVSADPLSFFPC